MRRYSASYAQSLNLVRSSCCSWPSCGTSCSNCSRSATVHDFVQEALGDIKSEANAPVLVCVVAPKKPDSARSY